MGSVSVSNSDASARIGPGIAGSNVRVTVHFLHHSRDDKKRQSQYRDSDEAPEYVAHNFIVPTSPANSETNDADRYDAAGRLFAAAGRRLRRAAASLRLGRLADAEAIMAEGCAAMDRAVALVERDETAAA